MRDSDRDASRRLTSELPRPRETARAALRRGTVVYHGRVDRLFTRFDLGNCPGYGRFLQAQARAYLPVEDALTQAGAAAVLSDWPTRCRGDLLRADLAALGLSIPVEEAEIAFGDIEAILGAVYVLEGSRLGGALLRRQVPKDLPLTFLAPGDSTGWRRLLSSLEEHLATDIQRETAIAAAVRVFTAFEKAAA